MSESLQTAGSSIGRFDVFSGALALLAFVIAFYALAAREHKTPYITNSLYSTAFIFLIVLFLVTVSRLFVDVPSRSNSIESVASLLLLVGVGLVIYRIRRMQNRHTNFRDDNLVKNLRIIRWLRNKWRSLMGTTRYEENPTTSEDWLTTLDNTVVSFGESIKRAAERARGLNATTALSLSIGCRAQTIAGGDEILVKLTKHFLKKNCFVQYATCTRHPFEFVAQVKKAWTDPPGWNEVSKRLVVVDAYSPHFAFTDAIHEEARKALEKKDGISCILSRPSFPGLHTATTAAFNLLKKQDDKHVRRPTLVIYDGPHALVDLESSEQYRIFIRHVIPSERQYGGMLTVFMESAIDGDNLALLRAYVDIFEDVAPSQS